MMTKNDLNFKLDKTDNQLTSKCGLIEIYELAISLGINKLISDYIPRSKSNRSYKPENFVIPILLTLLGGGTHIDDIREIKRDKALRKVCMLSNIPSSDSISRWLRNEYNLKALKKINKIICKRILKKVGRNGFTIDNDATYAESGNKDAKQTYKDFRGYSDLYTFIADFGLCISHNFRNGNISPATGIIEQLIESSGFIEKLDKKTSYFRSDSAAYQSSILNYCEEKGITFMITARKDLAVKKIISELPEDGWEKLFDKYGRNTGEEYYETVHTTNKSLKAFTLIVQRKPIIEKNETVSLFPDDRYKYHVIATNEENMSPEEIIKYANGRGNVENYIKETKYGFGMDNFPSSDFIGNAVWHEMGVLAYNLVIAFKTLILDEEWEKVTVSTLRWKFIFIAGKVIEHGRKIILKVSKECYELLHKARDKIRSLEFCDA